jgi:hypothetical protein
LKWTVFARATLFSSSCSDFFCFILYTVQMPIYIGAWLS